MLTRTLIPLLSPPWTPARFGGDLLFRCGPGSRVCADTAGATLAADAAAAAYWQDTSGRGNHLTQATANYQPVYDGQAGGLNFPTHGTGTVYRTFHGTPSINTRSFSLFAIGRVNALRNTFKTDGTQQSSRTVFALGLNPTDGNRLHFFHDVTTRHLNVFSGGAASTTDTGLTTPTSTALFGLTGSLSALTAYLNNRTPAVGSAVPAATLTTFDLWGYAADFFGASGRVYEVFGLNRPASAAEAALIQDYAARKYGAVMSGGAQVVIEGDSISQGGRSASGRGWHLSNLLPNTIQYNLSLSGITLATLNSDRLGANYYNAAVRNVMVVFAGTNDLAAGTTGANAYTTLSSLCAYYRGLGFKVVVVTMLPRGDASFEVQRQAFNSAIRAGWATFADALADVETLPMGAAGANTSLGNFDADQIHPNDTGHGPTGLAGLIGPVAHAVLAA